MEQEREMSYFLCIYGLWVMLAGRSEKICWVGHRDGREI